MTYEAKPVLRKLAGDAGPCMIDACPNRATVLVQWWVPDFGAMTGWYCDEHKPEGQWV